MARKKNEPVVAKVEDAEVQAKLQAEQDAIAVEPVAVAEVDADGNPIINPEQMAAMFAIFQKQNSAAADTLVNTAVEVRQTNFQDDFNALRTEHEEIIKPVVEGVEAILDKERVFLMADAMAGVADQIADILSRQQALETLAATTGVKIRKAKTGSKRSGNSDIAYRSWINFTSVNYVEWLIEKGDKVRGGKMWGDVRDMIVAELRSGKPFVLGPMKKDGTRGLDSHENSHRNFWQSFKTKDQMEGRLDAFYSAKGSSRSDANFDPLVEDGSVDDDSAQS